LRAMNREGITERVRLGLLITGTPGTGKSTVARALADGMGIRRIDINDLADAASVGYDEEAGSKVVDIGKLGREALKVLKGCGEAVVEGHLAHLLPVGDLVIVLRTDPKVLEGRLRAKGFGEAKVRENLEAEALDVCLVEALERHREVCEVDTTRRTVEETVACIRRIVRGEKDEFRPGKIDWSEEYFGAPSHR